MTATRQLAHSQMQSSADAIARAITKELPKLNPSERRELLVQTAQWLGERVAAMDEARAKSGAIVKPTKAETELTAAVIGKGARTSDAMDADARLGFDGVERS